MASVSPSGSVRRRGASRDEHGSQDRDESPRGVEVADRDLLKDQTVEGGEDDVGER
jgi:hypothetical protein